MTDFDFVIVGSGISGGWVAKELSERGFKVAVLERGRDIDPATDYTDFQEPWDFENLGQKTKQNRIFFVSALSALDGHIDKNVQAVSNSGIMEIKAALEKLVASERNSTKIRRVAIGTQSVARTAKSALSQLPPVNNSLSLQASIQGRLTDIEKELDSVIHEIQALAFDEN